MDTHNIINLHHTQTYLYLYKNKEYYDLIDYLLKYFTKHSDRLPISMFNDILLERIEEILRTIVSYAFTIKTGDLNKVLYFLQPSHPLDNEIIMALRYDIDTHDAFLSWYFSVLLDNVFNSTDSIVVSPFDGGLKIDRYDYDSDRQLQR